ncbi:dTDP-4-dehydrorhamnose reductase [Pelagibacteraceae bacterium]|nr:dTDP-4-dehydrorhamnose reductase [Pelagibacteraceae bacterium]
MKNKVLIFGSQGLLGTALKLNKNNNFIFKFYSKKRADITKKKVILSLVYKHNPKIIINCAAMTDVDLCEKNKKKAYQINSLGPLNLAKICNKNNILLIHISTDYLFNSKQLIKIKEDTLANPNSYYGRTKFFGEKNIIKNTKKYIIIRTSWLYGNNKNSFLKKIYIILKKINNINIVSDQYSLPTNVYIFAKNIYKILNNIKNDQTKYYGIYHYCDNGKPISRYEFAKYYFKLKNYSQKFKIEKIKSKKFYDKNIRPYNSSLSCKKITKILKISTLNWKKSLLKFIKEEKI